MYGSLRAVLFATVNPGEAWRWSSQSHVRCRHFAASPISLIAQQDLNLRSPAFRFYPTDHRSPLPSCIRITFRPLTHDALVNTSTRSVISWGSCTPGGIGCLFCRTCREPGIPIDLLLIAAAEHPRNHQLRKNAYRPQRNKILLTHATLFG